MTQNYKEQAFEEAIEEHFLANGYQRGNPKNFNRKYAIEQKSLFKFLEATQKVELQRLKGYHGDDSYQEKITARLDNEIKNRGMVDVLRYGITDLGVNLKMAYFRPASGLNSKILELYDKNIINVTRQLRYSLKNENSLDMVLSVNGLPVVTIELKNPLTGQTFENAIQQYKQDRDPRELLFRFNTRSLVHFAVDTEEVKMATHLQRGGTIFLPFNRGNGNGSGNPVNSSGYRTNYLWEEILKRDSLLEILAKFIHVVKEKKEGGNYLGSSLIFPRYHQLDVVRKLISDVRKKGSGQDYLIQHSAGSGKSNSIAWLAYQLSSLHDCSDNLIFDSVVVVTDRRVLDSQLQETIFQFDHKRGVVAHIDRMKGSKGSQLADVLEKGVKIIITTIQTFPRVLDLIEGSVGSGNRRYAIIADEAHSSQTGMSADKMNYVLNYASLEEALESESFDDELTDSEEEMLRLVRVRKKQSSMSFFAFTATPKRKTLEKFGECNSDGSFSPFHLYSMRQAIEEGFILDVLRFYTTYDTYFKLAKVINDDPRYESRQANLAIARFITLHPHNISQKTEVMIEHFRRITSKKIGERAKAMVVTSSRLHALRYKFAFDRYISEKGYTDISTLIAFSGSLHDKDKEWTESGINKFSDSELPGRFSSDSYQLLIVASKYQTGFDEPLLHTMYVDKKLRGVQAVQTLSRLNRIYKGKEDTFILDFVNAAEVIEESFQPYYEQTILEGKTDPNVLFDLRFRLDSSGVYEWSEVREFAEICYLPRSKQKKSDHVRLNQILDPSIMKYSELNETEKDGFRLDIRRYIQFYSYLAKIVEFEVLDLEKLYAFCKFLLKKLPARDRFIIPELEGDVELNQYRLEKSFDGSINLESSDTSHSAISAAIYGAQEEEMVHLSLLIAQANERFGTNFSEADGLFLLQLETDISSDETIQESAKANSLDNFKIGLTNRLTERLVARREGNEALFNEIVSNSKLQEMIVNAISESIYKKLE